jgi:signal transduction histidine kinase
MLSYIAHKNNLMHPHGKKLRKLVWLGSLIATLVVVFAIIASWILYTQTIALLTDNLRQRLLSISVTQAANIRPEALLALQSEQDWVKPEWREVVTQLKRAKDTNDDIVFMYIFRKTDEDPSQMEFVADAESLYPYANTDLYPQNDVDANKDGVVDPEGADKLQWPGQPYPEAVEIPEAYEAYNGPLTARELYEDTYGSVLTGYAPIRDQDGKVVAVLATDIQADDFFTITNQNLYPFLFFIAFLVLIIVSLSFSLILIWKRGAEAFANLSKKLEDANGRLKELDKMKSEFVSIASHQLRSPLTAIRGYASMLLEGSFGRLPKKSKEAIERIAESSHYMALSVEDYLNVSRIEAGHMKYELSDFDLKSEIEKVAEEMRPAVEHKGLALEYKTDCKGSCKIHADIGKTRQVLHNLIDNAMKYTPGGKISIVTHDDPGKRKIYVTIKDTGVGMSRETIDALFDKFVRAQNANKVNVTGTGLGLFVAKKMVEDMGGRIWAESEGEEKGSTFNVEFPEVP